MIWGHFLLTGVPAQYNVWGWWGATDRAHALVCGPEIPCYSWTKKKKKKFFFFLNKSLGHGWLQPSSLQGSYSFLLYFYKKPGWFLHLQQTKLQFEFLYFVVDFIFHLHFRRSLGKLRDKSRYYVNAWYPKPSWHIYWRTDSTENGRKGWRGHKQKMITIKPYLKILTASLTPVRWSLDGTKSMFSPGVQLAYKSSVSSQHGFMLCP